MNIIKYISDNGYIGILYGESSCTLFGPDNTECFHTGNRKINTYDELVQLVELYPQFIVMLQKATGRKEEDW